MFKYGRFKYVDSCYFDVYVPKKSTCKNDDDDDKMFHLDARESQSLTESFQFQRVESLTPVNE